MTIDKTIKVKFT